MKTLMSCQSILNSGRIVLRQRHSTDSGTVFGTTLALTIFANLVKRDLQFILILNVLYQRPKFEEKN